MAKRQSQVATGKHWVGTLQGISCIVLDRVGDDAEVSLGMQFCVCACVGGREVRTDSCKTPCQAGKGQ